MDIFGLQHYSLWLIAAAALTGLEMLTGTFYILLMAIAALAGCLAALNGFSGTQQLLVFGAFAMVECPIRFHCWLAQRFGNSGIGTKRGMDSTRASQLRICEYGASETPPSGARAT